MLARSHVVVAVAAWTWAAPHLGLPSLGPRSVGLAIVGALLPDIDHPSSWIGRWLRLISHPLAATFGHRGFTHSMVAVLACIILLRWQGFSRAVTDPLAGGYLSHLAADLLTTRACAWPGRHRGVSPSRPAAPARSWKRLSWSVSLSGHTARSAVRRLTVMFFSRASSWRTTSAFPACR